MKFASNAVAARFKSLKTGGSMLEQKRYLVIYCTLQFNKAIRQPKPNRTVQNVRIFAKSNPPIPFTFYVKNVFRNLFLLISSSTSHCNGIHNKTKLGLIPHPIS